MFGKRPFDRSTLPSGPIKLLTMEQLKRNHFIIPDKPLIPPPKAIKYMSAHRVDKARGDLERKDSGLDKYGVLLGLADKAPSCDAAVAHGGNDGEWTALADFLKATAAV